MAARELRRRHPRAHAARRRAARARRTASAGARRSSRATAGATSEVTAHGDRQRRRARGSRSCATRSAATPSTRERPPREGQPHRRAARARGGPRLHPAERRQADRLRDPVRGALLADRHDRRPGRPSSSIREISEDEIDYLLELANTYLEKPLDASRRRLDVQRRAAALRRRPVAIRRRSRATTC